jgi:hypothetical protein
VSFFTRNKECYLLSVPSGYVKVGISDSPERRLREIQAYCYEPVKFECATMLSAGSPVDAAMMEHLVHIKLRRFAGYRAEWFKTTPEIALNVMLTVHWFLAVPPDHPDIGRVHPDMSGALRHYGIEA